MSPAVHNSKRGSGLTYTGGPRWSSKKTGVNQQQLQGALDEVFDQALVYHAFTPYTRDYEVIVYATADPVTGIPPAHLRYLFRHCVEADTQSVLPLDIWRQSLDERLTNHETGKDLDGFVWGVNWQPLYPGMTLVSPSSRTQRWAEGIGLDFHEVRIETNNQRITLVFSELQVSELPTGYAPFVVDSEGA